MTRASQGGVIMVVDPAHSDYESLIAAGETSGIRFRFLSTVEEALRLHPPPGVLAWIINIELPPLSGLELYGLLRSRLGGVPVVMVDDQYDAARELSVLTRGGPHYLCKPLEASWIEQLPREARN